MTYLILLAFGVILFALLYLGLLMVGLQEADDPAESHPEELTEFEKSHVHRPDVHTES